MPKITLPDGSKKEVPNNTTLYDIAKDISNSLVKKLQLQEKLMEN